MSRHGGLGTPVLPPDRASPLAAAVGRSTTVGMAGGMQGGRRGAPGGRVIGEPGAAGCGGDAEARRGGVKGLRLQADGGGLGVRLLGRRRLRRALRYVIVPVNYWRSLEYRLALEECRVTPGERVLDVGSPK